MRKLAAALALLAAGPAAATGIEIEVDGGVQGRVVIDLLEDVAPKHVARITTLAAEGRYDGVAFHRVMEGFMAQTGDVQYGLMEGGNMAMAGTGGSGLPNLDAEFSEIAFERGVVGMARKPDPNSANSQFFIMYAPAPHLDGQYTVIGRVTEGMEVVEQIKKGAARSGRVTGRPDYMKSVTVTE